MFGNNTFDVEVRLSKDRIWGNEDDVVLGTLRYDRGLPAGETMRIASGKEALRTFTPAGSSRPSLVSLMDNHYLYRLTVRDTVPMNAVEARFMRVVVEPVGQ